MPRRALPAWFWTAILLVLCLLPRHLTPERRSMTIPGGLPHLDKVVHVAMFAAFGLLWTRAVAPSRRARMIFVVGVMLAVGTELAQGLVVVDRDPDLLDALADVAGLLMGMASYRLAPRFSTA
ncbi:MAG: VanZ family protein [Isosphaeraceae bacterium]|nr:VanZ family protein [Isosphaeraceae bacterium]